MSGDYGWNATPESGPGPSGQEEAMRLELERLQAECERRAVLLAWTAQVFAPSLVPGAKLKVENVRAFLDFRVGDLIFAAQAIAAEGRAAVERAKEGESK